jgi:hypothetical protein
LISIRGSEKTASRLDTYHQFPVRSGIIGMGLCPVKRIRGEEGGGNKITFFLHKFHIYIDIQAAKIILYRLIGPNAADFLKNRENLRPNPLPQAGEGA